MAATLLNRSVSLLLVPYFLAHAREGMGKGPEKFLTAGASKELERLGHSVGVITIRRDAEENDELAAVVEVNAKLAAQVRSATEKGSFPLVLAGTCNSCLGTLAGLGERNIGVVWFDAHGDFNTPATSPSGFLDGMALAMAAGLCHDELAQSIGLITPVPLSQILHLGGRDFDSLEREALQHSKVQVITALEMQQAGGAAAVAPALEKLREHVHDIYLHVDIDVLNSEQYPANEFPAPGGLALEELIRMVRLTGENFSVCAAALTAYNPQFDPEGKTLRAGLQVLRTIGELLPK
ncbi:MAG: arginase family protein [candidate division KSB1 bacterium]|nr:arginase family protein [candidate division KSB1 bacterium]MDZ7302891.1 arginase family protein [candidate division KSB1 bacterium]MDZ7310466.1 arginase family protein [candidate division KSB1 bacterium]